VQSLEALVLEVNKLLSVPGKQVALSQMLAQKAAVYVTQILRVLGVVEGTEAIGFSVGGSAQTLMTSFLLYGHACTLLLIVDGISPAWPGFALSARVADYLH
jgi:ethanolamine utilization microcompartment shell protein EutS